AGRIAILRLPPLSPELEEAAVLFRERGERVLEHVNPTCVLACGEVGSERRIGHPALRDARRLYRGIEDSESPARLCTTRRLRTVASRTIRDDVCKPGTVRQSRRIV